MITSFDIYILTRLDALNTLLGIMSIVFGLGCIFGLLGMAVITEEMDLDWKYFRRLAVVIPLLFILFTTSSTLLPTTKEAIAIWAVPKIANNETVKQIPENFAKIINEKLQEWMKDIKLITENKEKK